jgi:hypothetical protein
LHFLIAREGMNRDTNVEQLIGNLHAKMKSKVSPETLDGTRHSYLGFYQYSHTLLPSLFEGDKVVPNR